MNHLPNFFKLEAAGTENKDQISISAWMSFKLSRGVCGRPRFCHSRFTTDCNPVPPVVYSPLSNRLKQRGKIDFFPDSAPKNTSTKSCDQ